MVKNLKLNPSHAAGSRPGWPGLLALTLLVSIAHLWLMAAAPVWLALDAGRPLNLTGALQTRSVSTAASQPTQPATPATPATPPPAPPETQRVEALPSPPSLSIGTAAEAPTVVVPAEPTPPAAAIEPAPSPTAAASSAVAEKVAAAPESVVPTVPAAPAASPAPDPAAAPDSTRVPSPADSAAAPAQPPADSSPPPETQPVPPAPAAAPAADRRLAVAVPEPARLNYQISGRTRGFEYVASAQLDWQHDGQRYQARLVISSFPLPSRSQTSVGEIGPDGLSPRRFSDRSRREVAVHFQPELGRITFSASGTPAVWQSGAQDRLSLSLQLASLIAGDAARFTPGSTVTVLTAGSRNAEPWAFTVMGSETLSLPIGTQTALRLKRDSRQLYDQTIEIWFAPALAHLPVRILISQDNGDLIDQRLASIERP